MLWIALHLPSLSLETFSAALANGEAADRPLALQKAHRIVQANAVARALGVQPGLKRTTALSLAPQLTLGEADPARDADALTAVAHAALAFTPNVSLAPASTAADAEPPHTVLLEVRASLRYFGGLTALRRRLHDAVVPFGHTVQTVSAPTPLAATLLARAHRDLHCAGPAESHAALDAAPIWLLGPGRLHWDALQGMGLRTIADLRRLPRSGLARRFGEAVLDEVDRAYGQVPDPREPIALPPVFDSRLELFARADTTQQVVHGAGMLLPRLVAWLAAQHAATRRYTLVMAHEPRWRASQTPAATTLDVALAEPSRDAGHLLGLLQERLAQIDLVAPTLELRLQCADIVRLSPPNTELFPTSRGEREGLTRLIERLQARLGPAQVQCLREVEDHRPERATAVVLADAARRPPPARDRSSRPAVARPSAASVPIRPVWLLSDAEPLQEEGAGPLLGGRSLRLLSGPERIESGWWDGDLAQRDYYIAQDTDGTLLWIYRSRLLFSAGAIGWFLQGRFG